MASGSGLYSIEDRYAANVDGVSMGLNATPERRPLSVLECDLVGSTRLSDTLDPEAYRDCMLSYIRTVEAGVIDHGGYVAEQSGDSLMGYFGYPQASEDDSDRAIEAGLQILFRLLASRETAVPISARIGIATGVCVVGHTGEREPPGRWGVAAFGNVTNRAARIEKFGSPGTLLVDDATRRASASRFAFVDLGEHPLEGLSDPQRIWQVNGAREARGAFLGRGMPPLGLTVGRETELGRLDELWRRACQGHGCVVRIVGEPGVGKSRLVQEALARCAAHVGGAAVYRQINCSRALRGSPFAPFLELFRQLSGEPNGRDAAVHQTTGLAGRSGTDDNALAHELLGSLLADDALDPTLAVRCSPNNLRTQAVEALATLVHREPVHPLYLIVEDFQWMDGSSLEVLEHVVSGIGARKLLIVTTERSTEEIPTLAIEAAHLVRVPLGPLDTSASHALLDALPGVERLDRSLLDAIVDRTGGMPLYLEDFALGLVDPSESIHERSPMVEHADDIELPLSIRQHLMARVDRLGPLKRTAQIAAVCGEEFEREPLGRLVGATSTEVQQHLQELVGAGIVEPVPNVDGPHYRFRHALIGEAAYDSLLVRERVELHGAMARWMLEARAANAERRPEVVAQHFELAGEAAGAITYWIAAGTRSMRQYGYGEAIAQFGRAHALLEVGGALPETVSGAVEELRIVIGLAAANASLGGYSSAEAGAMYDRAIKLCEAFRSGPDFLPAAVVLPVYSGVGSYQILRGELANVQATAEYALDRSAEPEPSSESVLFAIVGNRLLGGLHFLRGRFDEARCCQRACLDACDEHREILPISEAYTLDHVVPSLCYRAATETVSGYLTEGRDTVERALRHAERVGNLHMRNYALSYMAALAYLRDDDPASTRTLASRSLELALGAGHGTWIGMSRILEAAATHRQTGGADALVALESGLEEYRRLGARMYLPFAFGIAAQAYLRNDAPDRATDWIEQAKRVMGETGECWYEPELVRLEGDILVSRGQRSAAERYYVRAERRSEELGTYLWRWRAAASRCRWLASEGETARARTVREAALSSMPDPRLSSSVDAAWKDVDA